MIVKQSVYFELEVINCRMFANIDLYLKLTISYTKFRFENTVFEQISLLLEKHAGLGSYVLHNCTFTKALSVDIQTFLDFKILSSINVPNDCDGTNVMYVSQG